MRKNWISLVTVSLLLLQPVQAQAAPAFLDRIAQALTPKPKPITVKEVPQPSFCFKNCTISERGVAFIRSFEGYSPFIYKDVAGLPTIGFGHLIKPGETFSVPLMGPDAEALLRKDILAKEKHVNRLAKVKLLQGQYDPVVSFAFNLGEGALSTSTLLKRLNANKHAEVPAEFKKWNKARDPKTKQLVVVRGLTIRRDAEALMYSNAAILP